MVALPFEKEVPVAAAPFTPQEYTFYSRQMILPELGIAGQQRLKESHVLVVGAGGLGAPALLYLAGAGLGRLSVIDDDQVELSNLHRQVIHRYAGVGNSKAESAAAALRSLNPLVEVRSYRERLQEHNIDRFLEGVDLVVDGSDNFQTRYLISAAAARAGIAHVWAAILGFDAQLSVFWAGRGPVYEDLYPQAPEGELPNCATAGVMGAMAGVVGASMAMESIKALTGIGNLLLGQVAYYSALDGRWEYIPLKARHRQENGPYAKEEAQAKKPGQNQFIKRNIADEFLTVPYQVQKKECSYREYTRLARLEEVVLLDVRERAEHAALAIPNSQNLPLSDIQRMQEESSLRSYISGKYRLGHQTIVVYCSGGTRAEEAAELLRRAGGKTVYTLRAGLAAWLQAAS